VGLRYVKTKWLWGWLVIITGNPALASAVAAFSSGSSGARLGPFGVDIKAAVAAAAASKEHQQSESKSVTIVSDRPSDESHSAGTPTPSYPAILSADRSQNSSRQKVPPPVKPRTPKKRNGSESQSGKGLPLKQILEKNFQF